MRKLFAVLFCLAVALSTAYAENNTIYPNPSNNKTPSKMPKVEILAFDANTNSILLCIDGYMFYGVAYMGLVQIEENVNGVVQKKKCECENN
jgi:hypothetical protein